jgi:PAS domain S-box-containing protein
MQNSLEKIVKANRLYNFISHLNQMIIRTPDEATLFQSVCDIAVSEGGFKMAWIGMVDEKTNDVVPVKFAGEEGGYLSQVKKIMVGDGPEGDGPTGKAIRQGEYIISYDIENDPQMAPWRNAALARGFRSSIAIPIKRFELIIGAFTVYAAEKYFFDTEEVALLETAAADISFALENIAKEEMRKKTEQQLRNSNARFEMITQATNDALWEWNLITGELWGNEIHQQLYGLNVTDPVPPVAEWQERIHPDDRDIIAERQASSLSSDKNVFISEYRFRISNNEYRDIYDRCYIVRDTAGQPLRMVGSMMDVTEQKNAAAQLKKEKDLSDSIISSLPGIFYLYDKKGKFIRWNEDFEIVSGYSGEEISRMHPLDFFDENEKGLVAERITKVFKSGFAEVEADFLSKDGTKRHYYFNGRAVGFGDKTCLLGMGIDITQLKRAEENIRHSEEKRRLIMNAALDAIVCMDTKGIITFWNPQAEIVFGWKEEEANGQPLAGIIIPERLREKHEKGMARYLKTGTGPVLNVLMELQAVDRKGREFPVELTILPIKQGGEEFFCSFIRDITERKNAAEEIERSEKRFRHTLDKMLEGVQLYDFDWRCLYVNDAVMQQGPYTKDQVLGATLVDNYPYIKETELFRIFEECKQEKISKHIEYEFTFPDGSKKWFELSIQPNPEGIFILSVDISERKTAVETILKEKELSDSIINSLPGIFYIFDANRKFVRWNRNFEKVSGYSADEMAAVAPAIFFDEAGLKTVQENFNKALAEQEAGFEANFITRSGEIIPYYFTGLLVNYNGEPCVLGTAIDIATRKKAEEEIKKINGELHELSAHLQSVREEERTQIARDIHDELGQQLTGLKMDIDWIDKKTPLTDTVMKPRLMDMSSLVEETIRSIRRISADLRPSMLDDFGLLASLEWQSREVAKRFGIEIDFVSEIPDTDLPEETATGLFRIYQEALTNAVKHAHAKKIQGKLYIRQGYLCLEIKDDGKGIDTKTIPVKKTFGLLGIRERVFLLHGKYDLTSEPGKGTCLSVAVPVKNNEN